MIRLNYLVLCNHCEYYRLCMQLASILSPGKWAKHHATRTPDHAVSVIELQSLKVVTRYQFTAIDSADDPPF